MEQTYFRRGFGLKKDLKPLIDAEYQSKGGEALTVDELGVGMRKLYGAFPGGLVIK